MSSTRYSDRKARLCTVPNRLVVCEPCQTEAEDDYIRPVEFDEDGNPIEEFPLEQMVEVALEYQPDAAAAPELFANM